MESESLFIGIERKLRILGTGNLIPSVAIDDASYVRQRNIGMTRCGDDNENYPHPPLYLSMKKARGRGK